MSLTSQRTRKLASAAAVAKHLYKLGADDPGVVALGGQDRCSCTQVALVEDEWGSPLVGGDTDVLEHEGSQEEVVDVKVGGECRDLVGDVVGSGTQSCKGGSDVHLGAGDGVVAQVDAEEANMVQLILGNLLRIGESRTLESCLLASNDWATAACRTSE